MNQDQVKEKLLTLRPNAAEFTVIFSGKQSKKINGLYYPETKEIIIHNKNFEDDNALMYTAIHEFAHHIGPKNHTTEFRAVFHALLDESEAKGIYVDTVANTPELQEMVNKIQELQCQQAAILKQVGQELMDAEKLCRKYNARFEDFIERGLNMAKPSAASAMKIKALDIPAELGPENMKTVVAIKNSQARNEAIEAMMDGETPDQVKQMIKHPAKEPDTDVQLMREKRRIQKAMDRLGERLEEIDMILEEKS